MSRLPTPPGRLLAKYSLRSSCESVGVDSTPLVLIRGPKFTGGPQRSSFFARRDTQRSLPPKPAGPRRSKVESSIVLREAGALIVRRRIDDLTEADRCRPCQMGAAHRVHHGVGGSAAQTKADRGKLPSGEPISGFHEGLGVAPSCSETYARPGYPELLGRWAPVAQVAPISFLIDIAAIAELGSGGNVDVVVSKAPRTARGEIEGPAIE